MISSLFNRGTKHQVSLKHASLIPTHTKNLHPVNVDLVIEIVFVFQAESLRKKGSRIEEENESLMMQLKKMATKARSMMNLIYVFPCGS
jgi:hypothetical protein